jgi:hypothetical protein
MYRGKNKLLLTIRRVLREFRGDKLYYVRRASRSRPALLKNFWGVQELKSQVYSVLGKATKKAL